MRERRTPFGTLVEALKEFSGVSGKRTGCGGGGEGGGVRTGRVGDSPGRPPTLPPPVKG